MKVEFERESELVDVFVENYFAALNELIIKEMPIRFGNIDVVGIENINLPFTDKQIITLSKPSCALLFTMIKNSRPVSRKTLIKKVGLSESTINNVLYELQNVQLIKKDGENFLRNSTFVFPKTIVTGYEAKLKDFNKAFYQAKNNKDYVDYSYLVFPEENARKILSRKGELLKKNNIGLIAVSRRESIILLKAKKINCMDNYMRLLNIAKAKSYCINNGVI